MKVLKLLIDIYLALQDILFLIVIVAIGIIALLIGIFWSFIRGDFLGGGQLIFVLSLVIFCMVILIKMEIKKKQKAKKV